ncbi:glycosyl hydrolase family 18 protein [Rouxiella sp. T17]|uniref:glycosyl hydrolase family 18 protein n=1 Tax=Rouxiella sp. T17 TaxID=3085684 RepID=UPI002FC70D53
MNDKTLNSKIIKKDDLTETTYAINSFHPKTETEKYSYTSARVMKPVYNKYKKGSAKTKVFGYYTDWSQYDGRLEDKFGEDDCGAGYDLANLPATAFDKIIFGFIGIVGDQGEKAAVIAKAAAQQNKVLHEPTFLDPWGDFQSYRNCGLAAGGGEIDVATVTQENSKGVLGGLRDLQQKAKTVGHELVLSMSIGGWTMSHAFHELAKTPTGRTTFALGVVKLFKQFPMFSELDIDWEYPGDKGNNNPFGPEDGDNYVALIRELQGQFVAANIAHIKISIAASAVISKIQHSKIKELIHAGLHGINLMTYDYFGTPWATKLAHHTNLLPSELDGDAVDTVIQYLIEQGVASENINIGYAGYSRNAQNAEIETLSPLKGTYKPVADKKTTGTLESGTSVWADIIYNYLDLENQCGRNGFDVYTDQVADADYLYNKGSKFFMSIDTPRTVKAKGEYAAKHNLGGVFTWTIDQDNGVLINAAREGLGYEIESEVIDMQPFYFEGINVVKDAIKPVDETKPVNEVINPFVKGTIELTVVGGASIQLTAKGYEGAGLTYQWIKPQGIVTTERSTHTIEIKVPKVTVPTQLTFQLNVEDRQNFARHNPYYVLNVVNSMDNITVDEKPIDEKPVNEKPIDNTDTKPNGNCSAWDEKSHVYSKGNKVSFGGVTYLCINPHTSNSGWAPGVAFTLWQPIA